MLKVSVGSTNPVKVKASEEAFERIGGEVKVDRCDVDSGVSDMPLSDREAIEGAKRRARKAKTMGEYDFGIGIEGSVSDTQFGMFLTGWAFLTDGEVEYLGGGGRLCLPEFIARRIRNGEELGPIMDEVTGKTGVKKGKGAIGVFTDVVITRKEAYRNALVFALSRYVNPELYQA